MQCIHQSQSKPTTQNWTVGNSLFNVCCIFFRTISVLKYVLLFTCKWWSFQQKKRVWLLLIWQKEIIKKAVTEFFYFLFCLVIFLFVFAYLYDLEYTDQTIWSPKSQHHWNPAMGGVRRSGGAPKLNIQSAQRPLDIAFFIKSDN